MPLETQPTQSRVQAPARAGIGLRWAFIRAKLRRPPAEWPDDWWQRNYDLVYDTNAPDPVPLSDRMMNIPPPPGSS